MSENNATIKRIKSDYMKQYDAHLRREKRRKRRLYRRLVAAGLVTFLVIGSLGLYHFNQQATYAELRDKEDKLDSEIALLEKEEASLREEIALLNDEEYVLDIARSNYFLSKKGEMIFLTEDAKSAEEGAN